MVLEERPPSQPRGFLERETRRFCALVVDPEAGLARRGVHFSEAQDYAVRDSSCYSSVMCFVLQRALGALGLPNPLLDFDYRKAVLGRYLAGDFFYDDATQAPYVAGDAAVLPFWSGLVGHDEVGFRLLCRVLERLDLEGLTDPLPCRYGAPETKNTQTILLDRINPWQRDAIWTCLGLQLVETLRAYGHGRYRSELVSLSRLVERHGCFPEVLDAHSAELYNNAVYMSEDSMLWAANLWRMLKDTP